MTPLQFHLMSYGICWCVSFVYYGAKYRAGVAGMRAIAFTCTVAFMHLILFCIRYTVDIFYRMAGN